MELELHLARWDRADQSSGAILIDDINARSYLLEHSLLRQPALLLRQPAFRTIIHLTLKLVSSIRAHLPMLVESRRYAIYSNLEGSF